MDSPVTTLAARRGRPRKFLAPSRAITLTLPEHVIDALGADRCGSEPRRRAPDAAGAGQAAAPPAELARYGQRAVIVVNPTRTLEQRTGVTLVPLPDGRALISFERPRIDRRPRADDLRRDRRSRGCRAPIRRLSGDRRDPARGAPVEGRHPAAAQHHRARDAAARRASGSKRVRRKARTCRPRPRRWSFVTGSGGSNVRNLEVPDLDCRGGARPRGRRMRRRQEPDDADPGRGEHHRPGLAVTGRQRAGGHASADVDGAATRPPTRPARVSTSSRSPTATASPRRRASNVAGFAATVEQDRRSRRRRRHDELHRRIRTCSRRRCFYWRARAVQGTSTGPWSPTARLKSKLVGFNRARRALRSADPRRDRRRA